MSNYNQEKRKNQEKVYRSGNEFAVCLDHKNGLNNTPYTVLT